MGSNMQRPEWWSSDIELAFEKFHDENPHVYRKLVAMACLAKSKGRKKLGIKMMIEVLRWDALLSTGGNDYKLNNNFPSRYARLIMEQEPDLAGMFEVRELKA